jgi:TonB family protein
MKLIQTALVALALAPSAFAEERSSQPVPFKIVVSTPEAPASHADYRYPYAAARKGMEGSCELTFTVGQNGNTQRIQAMECSSPLFESAAKSAVQGMVFPKADQPRTGQVATIRWDMQPTQLASAY